MSETIKDLQDLGFKQTHKIELDESGHPRFAVLKAAARAPSVYVWVLENEASAMAQVLYVGKAGKGVERRFGQHQNGFVNSKTGQKNAKFLTEVLGVGKARVSVWTRVADTQTLFGQDVSLYSAEEEALCAKLQPELNRAVFPDVASKVGPKDSAPSDVAFEVGLEASALSDVMDLLGRRFKAYDEGTLDDLVAQLDAYSDDDIKYLKRILTLLEERYLEPTHSSKLVGGYTDQIKGCDGIPALAYGYLRNRNFAPKGWVARVFLAGKPRLALPMEKLNSQANADVEFGKDSFSPNDLEDLLRRPSKYLRTGSADS
jgi:hypothetical protein